MIAGYGPGFLLRDRLKRRNLLIRIALYTIIGVQEALARAISSAPGPGVLSFFGEAGQGIPDLDVYHYG